MKILQTILMLQASLGAATVLSADGLVSIYEDRFESADSRSSDDYRALAARENVVTQQRGYLPRVSLEAKELWIDQDIDQDEIEVLRTGREDFRGRRFKVEVEQPLIDATIFSRIDAATSRLEHREALAGLRRETEIRQFVFAFLEAARARGMAEAYRPVIERLETELANSEKSLEENVATVTDVENIRIALAAMKQERGNAERRMRVRLAEANLEASALEGVAISFEDLRRPELAAAGTLTEVDALRAEMGVFASMAETARRETWPRLQLVGTYEYDDADDSVFGGARTVSQYEVGVAIRWDIFDRAANYSEAREMDYLRRAVEAEMLQAQALRTRRMAVVEEAAANSESNIEATRARLERMQAVSEAKARGYDAGTETYIAMVNAFLQKEGARRAYVDAYFEAVMAHAELAGESVGWGRESVEYLDRIL